MIKKEIKGILEIDPERGVIYFHDAKTGQSILRICNLPKPIPTKGDAIKGSLLDITHMVGCSWSGKASLFYHNEGSVIPGAEKGQIEANESTKPVK
jgi:hypothetical protein